MGTFVICCRQRHASEKKTRIAVTTHKRIIRGGAVMLFTRCSVPACRQVVPMSSISFLECQFAHEKRTLSDTPKDMCTGKSRHMRFRQQYFMVVCKRRTLRGLRPFAVGFHVSACHRSFCGWHVPVVHRMVAGTMCVDRCLPSDILLMHTWSVDSLIAGRVFISSGM